MTVNNKQEHEDDLYKQLASYISLRYPGSPCVRLRKRGFPGLFVAVPKYANTHLGMVTYHGLFIRLKRHSTRLKTKGDLLATAYIGDQAAALEELAALGYIAQFAIGLQEAMGIVDSYLSNQDPAQV